MKRGGTQIDSDILSVGVVVKRLWNSMDNETDISLLLPIPTQLCRVCVGSMSLICRQCIMHYFILSYILFNTPHPTHSWLTLSPSTPSTSICPSLCYPHTPFISSHYIPIPLYSPVLRPHWDFHIIGRSPLSFQSWSHSFSRPNSPLASSASPPPSTSENSLVLNDKDGIEQMGRRESYANLRRSSEFLRREIEETKWGDRTEEVMVYEQ